MRGKFIGVKDIDFTSDQGERVNGIKVAITCPDPDWLGSSVTIPFIKFGTTLYNKIKGHENDFINRVVDVDYLPGSGGRLKIADITLLKE